MIFVEEGMIWDIQYVCIRESGKEVLYNKRQVKQDYV
jgi:hypothetical protein